MKQPCRAKGLGSTTAEDFAVAGGCPVALAASRRWKPTGIKACQTPTGRWFDGWCIEAPPVDFHYQGLFSEEALADICTGKGGNAVRPVYRGWCMQCAVTVPSEMYRGLFLTSNSGDAKDQQCRMQCSLAATEFALASGRPPVDPLRK